ncbi:RNA polymerase sigma24 factor [Nonomuraea sp. TT08I-71]|nr:RNA polymerase sigma24 factor [Nonomuraea sp. TT08I-71]
MPSGVQQDEGRKEEFIALYHASYGKVASQLHAYLGNRAEAEDVAQEAFTRAWRQWSKISKYEDPIGWVRRVGWNIATSRLRRAMVAARVMRRQHNPRVVPEVDPNHVAIVAALRTLPARQRRAVVLHYIADLPIAEVAAELDVPKGTVLSWLHRARAQLAAQLSSETHRR